IEKLHTGVTSDVNGFYTFSNLDPGTYTVKVSYVGYSPVELKITIPAGRTLEKDVVLNEGVELQEVVVGGAFQGQRRAINSQKNNMGITNVVSADQVGKFPDSNIGDALKRISGINVQYDQGEARFGQVRGTSADLSSVTINGNRVPSAEGDTRNVQLDLIPADMIQTIEVNKVVTADMDGDAIGGSINLVTKNSPYKRTIAATAGTGYNWVSEKAQLNLGFTYGDRFFNDKLGLIVSASYQNSPSGSYDTEFVWEQDDNGKTYVNDYQIRQYYVTRERQSYSAALDWDINANHKLTFKGIFNNRNDWENRYRTTLKDLDPDGNATVRIQTKAGTPDNRNARLERQRTMDFALGGEHLFGALSMDWHASYAKASEERPNERYIDFQLKKQKFDMDLSDERQPFASPKTGSTMTLNDEFSLKELTEQQEDIKEQDLKFSANFKLPFKNGNKLKFGAKVVRKTKDKEVDFYEYSPLDEDAFMTNSLANTVDQTNKNFMPNNKYQAGIYASKEYTGSLDLNNASLFEKEQVQEELAGNFNARETVTSGYLRFDQKLTKDVELMTGLRIENTNLAYTGRTYDADEDLTSKTDRQRNSYINFLPSLLVKWNVNDDFKVRGSFTQTLSRPKYSALVPSVNIKRSDNEITIGNPELKPTVSYNFDLSADYYFRSIGLISAGIFYKKIDDFIVDQVSTNYEYQGNTYTRFTQPKNAGNANLVGVELSYQRDFSFIAPALKCVGFYGTYTYTHSRVEDFNFEGRENEKDLSMPGSPEHTANASLYFEKGGLNLRLSYNFASDFIDEMGESTFYDRYYDKVNYMDVNASYTFGKKFKTTFYAEANNLLNQPLRYYQGTKDRTMQAEYYGVKVNAGVKINF
ncbi:MAG: TonB-dependent receptor, partial [Bacteroides uniformis]